MCILLLYSNTTLVKVKLAKKKNIKMLQLIQIQHLLKLNADAQEVNAQARNSNTTLVKVKSKVCNYVIQKVANSNTTLVKVKCNQANRA